MSADRRILMRNSERRLHHLGRYQHFHRRRRGLGRRRYRELERFVTTTRLCVITHQKNHRNTILTTTSRREWSSAGLPFFTSASFQDSLDRVCDRMGVSTEFIEHNRANAM